MKNLVLYHGNCYDGFGAAFAAWKSMGDEAEYRSVSYGKPIPEDAPKYAKVFIVDFSYPADQILMMSALTKVVVLDHHVTAQAALIGLKHPNLEIVFDMNRSGAGITWDRLHQEARPSLINHIEDRDLWRFKLEGSKEIHAALVSHPMDFKLWDTFDVEQLKTEGQALLRMQSQLVENICQKPWMKEIGGYKVPVVNTSISWSEVGAKLLEKFPDAPFVASFTEFETDTMWSLRSKEPFDVSAIAKQYGGGGHAQAAGFKINKP